MMRTLLINILVFVLAIPTVPMAQVYNKRMDEAIALCDTALQRKVLVEWKFEWPDDPDMSLAQSGFYQRKSALEGDSIAKANYLTEAHSVITRAKQDFRDRLDIRLAHISLIGDMGEYREYTGHVLDLLDAHDQLGDDWLWRDNKKLVGANDFVRQYIDMYTLLLYNRKDEALYPLMDTISNRVLQSYPQHVPALLSLSINALHRQDYEDAIGHLQQANTLDPTNTSVLDNLGTAYERTGNRERAIVAYEQIQKHGNEQEKGYATRKIDELSKP